MIPEHEFLTVKEFAQILRVHVQTVRKGIKYGRIQATKSGTGMRASYRIPKAEVNRLCELDTLHLIQNLVKEEVAKAKEISSAFSNV